MSGLGWTPHDGETVHLAPGNRWQLPAGRYRLDRSPAGFWHLVALGIVPDELKETRGISGAHLIAAEVAQSLTPISAAEIERSRQVMELQSRAPLRGMGRQHDASDLALFRAADEGELDL